ncbi:hypothetical protein BDF20DRAFT_974787 [Mycotypha africana]|uniref:uncharacterized protein n=1 Tax=Mycotypha africana TaxID=64632 RepID=UPI00230118AE|nr:uncharacterized protein BDF20DRAFT_974787 [Mycotypha africana]KAI8979679.1 hypothetical protein BDF20DRAFT_974787 [Mycotypha africana]
MLKKKPKEYTKQEKCTGTSTRPHSFIQVLLKDSLNQTNTLTTKMPIFNKRKISQLPPELSDFPLLHSSSSNTSPRTISTIESATIISFEKHSDKKMWYVMEIETQQHQHHFTTKRTYYRIARRYVEFARLSQKLYKRFKTTKLRAGGYLPPKIKTNKLKIFPVSKELQNRRLEELNQFLKLLFRKQSIITESSTVFEFFKPRASDLKPTHGWKLLRCTSILSRSSASTSSISSFCTQAVHKLISPWHPSQHQQCRHHQQEEGECSAIPILDDRYNNVIKFKIICDMDNIVIIRVSRIISLIELRERIMNKFAERHGLNISVGYDDFVLLYNDTNGNRCNARTVLENELVLPARVIRKEEDLKDLLQNKWKEFDRVALRCIIV